MTEYRCYGWDNRLACLLLTDPVHNCRLRELLDGKQDGVDRGCGVETDGGIDVSPADVARRETEHERAARRLRKAIPGPEPIRFPDGWQTSGSWHRAQASPSHASPNGPAEFSVLLGHPNTNELGDRHRVTFAILDGELVTRCDCDGYEYRGWCAHVAHLWWRWSQRDLSVVDLNTGRTWTSVPSWLHVDDRDVDQDRSLSRLHVAADGGDLS